jgi:poly-gamma-glutamate synthesis protein (capsule biosynthesis protein)
MDLLLTILSICGGVVGAVVLALIVCLAVPFRYPRRTESDYGNSRFPWFQLYYSNKWLRPMRRAARGSGLERYFAEQDFTFDGDRRPDRPTISIAAVGDLMFRRDLVGDGGARLWDEVGEELFGADLSIGNLELAVNRDWVIEKLLRYSVPPSLVAPLLGDPRFGRFDVLTLANNHINDSLHQGIVSTCDYLDSLGVARVGASTSAAEQQQVRIVDVGGIRVAVLAYTFSTNGIPLEPGCEFGTNLVRFNALENDEYDSSLIVGHVAAARAAGADYVISCHHWGIDHEFYPPPRLVERAHDLLDAGIDLIVGHHPHVVGPVERYRAADGRDCIVCYSLGNVTTRGLPFPFQRLGQLMRLSLAVETDPAGTASVRPVELALTPFYHARNRTADGIENRLLRVTQGVEAIEAGQPPPHFSRSDIRNLPRLQAAFREQLQVRGVRYR